MEKLLIALIIVISSTLLSHFFLRSKKQISYQQTQIELISEIKKMKEAQSSGDIPPHSLEHGLKVVTGQIPSEKAASPKTRIQWRVKKEILEPIIATLEYPDISVAEREQALELLMPEAGKNPQLDNDLYRACRDSLETVLHSNPKLNTEELKKQIDLSVTILIASRKNNTETIHETAQLLKEISDTQTRQLVINSLVMHTHDPHLIFQQLEQLNIPVSKKYKNSIYQQ